MTAPAAANPEAPSPKVQGPTVLLVANYPPDVGFAWWLMESFWVQIAELARPLGLHPLIVYPKPGEVPEAIRASKIDTLITPFPGSGLSGLLATLKLIRARRVRFVYFTDRGFTSLKYLLARLAGVKLILNHDHTPGDRPPVVGPKGLLKALWRRLTPVSCDLQLCVSPLIQERAIANARIPERRTTVVQNGIRPIECTDDRHYAHRELGIPVGASICVTVCRAHRYKRVEFVIEVARRAVLEMKTRDLYFVHCGDGPDLQRLGMLRDQAGLRDRFVFAGRRSDVEKLLCSSKYALHPAKGEAFSLAILEYMSAGLAVLVPNIPTVRQAIRDGETGLVFSDGDAGGAAERLVGLHRNPERAAGLGAAASLEVRRNYSFDGMNRSFRKVISDALASVSPGST